MTPEEQLKEWVNGNPIHNDERGECCPDFSCCNGKIAPLEVRERFAKAYLEGDEKTVYTMLVMFLSGAFADENIYIAGDEAIYGQVH